MTLITIPVADKSAKATKGSTTAVSLPGSADLSFFFILSFPFSRSVERVSCTNRRTAPRALFFSPVPPWVLFFFLYAAPRVDGGQGSGKDWPRMFFLPSHNSVPFSLSHSRSSWSVVCPIFFFPSGFSFVSLETLR